MQEFIIFNTFNQKNMSENLNCDTESDERAREYAILLHQLITSIKNTRHRIKDISSVACPELEYYEINFRFDAAEQPTLAFNDRNKTLQGFSRDRNYRFPHDLIDGISKAFPWASYKKDNFIEVANWKNTGIDRIVESSLSPKIRARLLPLITIRDDVYPHM
jgi:hypothetical protein